jgi:hypothetical protein
LPGPAQQARLSQTTVPATGTHDALLTVTQFGRYAIIASSKQGVALQLVDRMAGPGAIAGVPGQSDGRLDLFLDRGTYKIHIIADAHGTGIAKLRLLSFQELQTSPVQLVENKPVVGQLGDGQQISWWLNVPQRGTYDFEAGGRYLNELRLWKDGGWITADVPIAGESDADPEQPLALRQLSAQLEPGLYRLTAYGGPSMPWSSGAKDAPFLLRWGVPQLADSGRTVHTASLLGIDRYLIPGTAADVRLVLDKSVAASLFAQPYAPETMFESGNAQEADITKTSRDPVADLPLTDGGTTPWLVTVYRKPGAAYRLEVTNEQGNSAVIAPGYGDALIATTLQGDPDDELDPGFILVNVNQSVVQSSVINLNTALPWRRRFNLLGVTQTFLHTGSNINLKIDGNAQFIVDRFLINAPPDRVVPTPKPSGGVWTLTPGYYVLDVLPLPNGLGVTTMSMYADGTPPPVQDSPRLPAALFPDVMIDPINGLTLFSSFADNVGWGLRPESLPAALAQPLSFELAPGQRVNIPIQLAEKARLTVSAENGQSLGFAVDGKQATGSADLDTNQHQLGVTWPGPDDMFITLAQTPLRLLDPTLPPLPADQMKLPDVPVIQPGQPAYVDLDRRQTDIFGLKVDKPALYRFETTGLIETGGTIRTRIVTSLGTAEGNGIGRNFMLQQYLDQGDYQLTVQAQGQTTGHAGVAVTATPVRDGGVLTLDLPSRITLEPGDAALYRFHIAKAASYHLFTLGLNHQFAMRLEDADGWPLTTPGGAADTTMDFAPGDYRMVLLPGTVENRAVTMLQDFPPPVSYAGHGPFAVVLGQDLQNRWMEPPQGKPRLPDVWTLSLPAAATLTFSLDSGMKAQVFAAGAATPAVVLGGGGWTGSLGPGDYHIDVVRAVPDNRVDYTLHIDSKELLPGQSVDVQAPQTIPVSLGGQPVEISSFGGQDVRAVLYDARGHIAAANDDRDNDWNFLIAGAFPAGKYQLEVDPVGADNAQTTVSIAAPALRQDTPLSFGQGVTIADGLVHLLPVPAPKAGTLLLVGAAGAVPVGLAVECPAPGGWRTLASTAGINPHLAIPAAAHGYRLRVWAEDHGDSPITVTALALAQPVASGPALASGLALSSVALGPVTLGVGHVALASPAILVPSTPPTSLQWSSSPDVPAAQDAAGTITAASTDLWLVDAAPHVQAAPPANLTSGSTRLTILAGQRITIPVPQASSSGVVLWQAQAQGSQPGIATAPGGVMAAGHVTGLLASTLAVQMPGAGGGLALWQAGPARDATLVTLQGFAFPTLGPARFAAGMQSGILTAGGGVRVVLPPGFKRLTLTLPAGTAAALVKAGRVIALIAADGTAPDVLDSDAPQLLLLNPSATDLPYNVQLQPEAAPGLTLAAGGLLTAYSAAPAILHVTLPAGRSRLRIGGSATSLLAIGAGGMVSSGNGALAAGGQAIVATGPGLAVLSADGPASGGAGRAVTVPGNAPLWGKAALLSVPPGPARLVTMQTDVPVVLRDRVTGIPTIYPSGAAASLFQPKGQPLDIDILAAGAAPLGGAAHFAAIQAIPITDGLGPHDAVGPGQSRLFSFSLTSARLIGVGVRGDVDDAICRLLASDGTELGRGVVQMHDLAPGTYYLAVDVPADGVTTNLQPSLVGLTPPDDGPPPDVIDSYRDLASAAQTQDPAP